MALTYEEVARILRIVDQDGFTELQIEHDGLFLKVRKGAASTDSTSASMITAPARASASNPVAANTAQAPARVANVQDAGGAAAPSPTAVAVRAPMPGTFYQAPAPGEKPFVQVGDTVSAGQVVCILDVMKVMNQLTASAPGRVVRVDVRDADSVAAGQAMIWIEPA